MTIFPGRRGFWIVLAVTVCLFLLYSAAGERGLIRLNHMIKQRNQLRSRVLALEKNNAALAEQVGLLRDDPATIEKLARTELGMVREGETVYILTERSGEPKR